MTPLRYAAVSAFFLAVPAVAAITAAAQPLVPTTAFSAGGPNDDVGEDVAVDGAGNVFVVGTFEGTAAFGALTLTAADDDPNADWTDVFVVKYDAQGDVLWARRAGSGLADDFAEGVALRPFGSSDAVYVAGSFTGTATWDGGASPDVALTTRGGYDGFLAKYDADGDLQWVAQVGGAGEDSGRGVAVTYGGAVRVYFAGAFAQTATFGADATLTSAGSGDAFLAQYDVNGNLLWVRQGGGAEGDGAWNVTVSEDAAAYVVGTFGGLAQFGALPLQSRGHSDLFVVRYGADGTEQWVQGIGGAGSDHGRGVAAAVNWFGDERVYVAGSFEDTVAVGSDTLTSAGLSDVLLGALTSDGTVVWGVRGGGSGADVGNDVVGSRAFVDDFSVSAPLVMGTFEGPATFYDPASGADVTLVGYGSSDGFLASYFDGDIYTGDDRANLRAVMALGGAGVDRGHGIGTASPASPREAVTGAFRGAGDVGTVPLVSAGGDDVYVGLFNVCDVNACIPATEPVGLPVFALSSPVPNPFSDRTSVTLTLTSTQPVRAEVIDLLGRRVALLHDAPLAAGLHTITWGAAGTPSGVYLIRVTTAEGTRTRRVTRLR